MKKNNKGFVLVETLVVTVFVAAVFSVIYINFYPLVGEYERRDFYDDLDSKYGTYWMKVFAQKDSLVFNSITESINSRGYYIANGNEFCNLFPENSEDRNLCLTMAERLHVNKLIITFYRLDGIDSVSGEETVNFKEKIVDANIGESFQSYIEFLPNFVTMSEHDAKYRILVEFARPFDTSESADTYYTYANMEVIR